MFLHREAFPNAMYYTQTRCKLMRHLETKFGDMVGIHRLYDKIHQKHFKKYYNGKPTKRYKKLMERINKAQSIPYDVYFREFNKYRSEERRVGKECRSRWRRVHENRKNKCT